MKGKWVFPSILVGLFALALCVRLYGLTAEVIWLDEVFSIRNADEASFSDVISRVLATENTPPLYFILLRFWRNVSTDPGWTRFFSTVAGVMCVGVIGWLGYCLGGKGIGLVAAFFSAISEYQIYYSQEARVYALLMLSCAVSWSALLYAFANPSKKWAWIGYCASVLLGIHLHYCFWFSACGQVCWMGYRAARFRRVEDFPLKPLLYVLAVTILGAMPVFWVLVQQVKKGGTEWIPSFNWDIFVSVLRSTSCGVFVGLPDWVWNLSIALALVGWVSFCMSRRWEPMVKSAIVCASLLPLAMIICFAFYRPIISQDGRYICIVQPFFVLALVVGMISIPKHVGWAGLLALGIIWVVVIQLGVETIHKRRYDLAANFIVERQAPNDRVIVIPNYSYETLSYFRPTVASALDIPKQEWPTRFKRILESGRSLWIVSIVPTEVAQERLLDTLGRTEASFKAPNGPFLKVTWYTRR